VIFLREAGAAWEDGLDDLLLGFEVELPINRHIDRGA
jgi:hypothetical protein